VVPTFPRFLTKTKKAGRKKRNFLAQKKSLGKWPFFSLSYFFGFKKSRVAKRGFLESLHRPVDLFICFFSAKKKARKKVLFNRFLV